MEPGDIHVHYGQDSGTIQSDEENGKEIRVVDPFSLPLRFFLFNSFSIFFDGSFCLELVLPLFCLRSWRVYLFLFRLYSSQACSLFTVLYVIDFQGFLRDRL